MTRRSTWLLVGLAFAVAAMALAVAAAFLAVWAGEALAVEPKKSLGVVYEDGRNTEDIPLYMVEDGSEELYIAAYDLARIFRATKFWSPGSRKLVLRISGERYLFTLDTRVVLAGEEPRLLHVPVRYQDGAVMIPLEFIPLVLVERIEGGLEFDEKRLLLTVGSPKYNIASIAFKDSTDGSRAIITMKEELLYHVDSDTPGLLRIKIYGGKLNPLKFSVNEAHGLFNRVRAEQTEHDSYLFFDVKRTVRRFQVSVEPPTSGIGQRKLIVFLEKGELPEIPESEFAGMKMIEIPGSREGKGFGPIKKVAIDPGHGGIDRGKVSPSGIMEKDVNLDVAMMLADRLKKELGVEVVLTRTEDVLIPLDKRAEIANSAGADLFISLHCNGWFTPEPRGIETFFLAPARTEDEARLAKEENASMLLENPSIDKGELDEIEFILWDMVQNQYISESSELAEVVQRELCERVKLRNRGVKQAGLRVLKGLNMPAVLVEMGFLSNPDEEKLLVSETFREKVVEAIVDAVRKFKARYASAQR